MQTVLSQTDARPDMSDKGRIALIAPEARMPDALQRAMEQLGLDCFHITPTQAAENLTDETSCAVAVVLPNGIKTPQETILESVLQNLQNHAVPVAVFQTAEQVDAHVRKYGDSVLYIQPDESAEMIQGRLLTLLDMQRSIQLLHTEIDRLKTVSQPLNSYFSQVNEEMRIASRLQRDFLPEKPPEVEGIEFATIFRPASWVSGDIYDISRLDENHIGFYIADAVGHGMPAALLTMFIIRAMVTKIIDGNNYFLVEPGDALKQLNADMVAQELNNFQFATCCYGLLNIDTLRLRVSSAGHPAPMHILADGQMNELDLTGSLLGVFPEQKYDTIEVQIRPGEKILMYSDGVELAFVDEGPDKPLRFRKEFGNLAELDIQTMCDKLVEIINREEGSLHPRDDVTIIGLDFQQQ
jgi:serine phosphatase RsbU (regulator of sigma subunit)